MDSSTETPPQSAPHPEPSARPPSLLLVLLLTAMAGGMGWGIRGQYGHETGAMVPGLLIALTVALLFAERLDSLQVARAVGLAALGMGFGASETYGQTVGLTHDPPFHGNWHALLWGMTGLFVKGGVWVGFAGAFLGMGLSVKRYRAREVTLLLLLLTALLFTGAAWLNEPFQPEAHRLPAIYFSSSWTWEPGRADLRPRRENWGGLLLALAGLLIYLAAVRKDRLARNLALFGVLFGGAGWVFAQGIQAFHAWNQSLFQSSWFGRFEPYMNWWNLMETTFGAALGAGLGLGVWMNRGLLGSKEGPERADLPRPASLWDGLLIAAYLSLLVAWEFLDFSPVEALTGGVFTMALVPMVGLLGGRYFPYAMVLPLLVVPIAGKTLRQLCYKTHHVPPVTGWLVLLALPVLLAAIAAWILQRRGAQGEDRRTFARRALLITTWVYFWLNFAFFEFPWPWAPLTFRASNTLIFTVCLAGLTTAALKYRTKEAGEAVAPESGC